MWELVVALCCVFVGYVIYVLGTSSGSAYSDNSIEAFIDKDDTKPGSDVTFKQTGQEKYCKTYTTVGRQILVLFGTEYGYSEEVAKLLWDRISQKNVGAQDDFQPRLVNARDYQCIQIEQEQVCFLVIATSGDGVPPSDAQEFYQYIMTYTESLNHLAYSVLALGDSNYPQFCKTGRSLDWRLSELGAVQVVSRCDVDMEDSSVVQLWMDRVMSYLDTVHMDSRRDYLDLSCIGQEEGYNRHRPYMAVLKEKRSLTVCEDPGDKETIHCEFDMAGSGLDWTSGDALGIYPRNNPAEVDALIQSMKCSQLEIVPVPNWAYQPHGGVVDLYSALLTFYDLKHVKPELLLALCEDIKESSQLQQLRKLLQGGVTRTNIILQEYLKPREVIDVLQDFNTHSLSCDQIIQQMKALQPRYYSISSSPVTNGSVACVTAAVVRYETLDQLRTGVTTTYLQDRLCMGDTCPVFISRNPDFRLPADKSCPVILIGPGTGIAPFRAFIQERAQYNEGEIHLYFGCRHRSKDYLYKDELEKWKKNGIIFLKVAFSRDQHEKVYVQDLLQEDCLLIWKLINTQSASIYMCGDAKHMAQDVHKTLLNITQVQGQRSRKDAVEYLHSLEVQFRYQKDVWVP